MINCTKDSVSNKKPKASRGRCVQTYRISSNSQHNLYYYQLIRFHNNIDNMLPETINEINTGLITHLLDIVHR
jgi:hypothetical protein